MFAINHAATALVLKKKFKNASMFWLLLSVQFVELLWVLLNIAGVEYTATNAEVHSVADIHLAYMPWSHSVATCVLFAMLAWAIIKYVWRKPVLALPVALGILSHIVLDLGTHVADISISPLSGMKIGLGVYAVPMLGLFVETGYGIWCWWYAGAGRRMLFVILFFNLSNLSFFSSAVPGPESLLAGHPMVIVGVILLQIVVTLWLTGRYYRPGVREADSQRKGLEAAV